MESFKSGVQPFSIFGLLVTVVLLFGFQGEVILGRSLVIALIGTLNILELAVAVAISLFGLGSDAALATVFGVLVDVPEMLSLIAFDNRIKHWFPTERDAS